MRTVNVLLNRREHIGRDFVVLNDLKRPAIHNHLSPVCVESICLGSAIFVMLFNGEEVTVLLIHISGRLSRPHTLLLLLLLQRHSLAARGSPPILHDGRPTIITISSIDALYLFISYVSL